MVVVHRLMNDSTFKDVSVIAPTFADLQRPKMIKLDCLY